MDEEKDDATEVTSDSESIDIDESITETYQEKRDTYQAEVEGLNIVTAGLGGLDQIDMNYQVTHDGKNTGGVLKYGTNNVKVFFKNKTSSTITFEPLVLWGEYDSIGELQTTYFQWCDPVTVAAKGQNGDVLIIDYKVKAPNGTDFACAYWAINSNYDYVCLNPIAMRVDGLYQGQATPLFFQEAGGGKYIYCNNREGITRADLADGNNPYGPRLLMHEKGLGNGEYEMMVSHNNNTSMGIDLQDGSDIYYDNSFPIYVDVQFYDPYGTATIEIESAAFYIPTGKVDPYSGEPMSYACIQAYANYSKMTIYDLTINNPYTPQPVLRTKNSTTKYIHNFSENASLWAGDVFTSGVYTSVPNAHVMYMVLKFKIVNSKGIEVNIAAVKDNGGGLSNRFSDYRAGEDPNVKAPYYKDYQYKGIANTLPLVETRLIMAFNDDNSYNSRLPVIVFNEFERGGVKVDWWKTQINPQNDRYYADHGAQSDILKFRYNDPTKYEAYGNSFSGAKDGTWKFDVFHSDTFRYPNYRSSTSDPNFVLPRPNLIYNPAQGFYNGSSNVFDSSNLANYGVITRYNYEVYNYSEYQRFINFNLETSSNNVIVLRNPSDPEGNYIAMYKGENSSKVLDTFFFTSAEGVGGYNGVGIIVDIILPTGNAGGMENSIVVY